MLKYSISCVWTFLLPTLKGFKEMCCVNYWQICDFAESWCWQVNSFFSKSLSWCGNRTHYPHTCDFYGKKKWSMWIYCDKFIATTFSQWTSIAYSDTIVLGYWSWPWIAEKSLCKIRKLAIPYSVVPGCIGWVPSLILFLNISDFMQCKVQSNLLIP